MSRHPLYVDLDGTLIRTDVLWEGFVRLLFAQPLAGLMAPWWLVHGRARLKQEIARRVTLDASTLPYHEGMLNYLRAERESGRRLVLATAADAGVAGPIAAHVGLFDGVLASDGRRNLSRDNKLHAIQGQAGTAFAYAGNSNDDIPIWSQATTAVAVNAPTSAVAALRAADKLEVEFRDPARGAWHPLVKAIRPHQWLKNLLVFLPLLPIATTAGADSVLKCLLAFIAFSLCASSVYLINDLSDLDADRAHPRKRLRPFAAGTAPLKLGLAMAPLLVIGAFAIAAAIGWSFGAALAAYLVLTTAYTFALKRFAMVDVITLAGLYTLRVVAGAAAIAVPPSFWILAFSMFIFLSLALAKRCAELLAMRSASRKEAAGRGYRVDDLATVQQMGIAAGFVSALVMALYLNSPELAGRYQHPQWLWGVCPLLLLWIGRVWMKVGRAEMHDDPLVFALRDRLSRLVMVSAAGLVLLALLA